MQSACTDRLSAQSLVSLGGILVRHAERLGFHRDGNILNLSPFETEKRRRIWWQLQHQDASVAMKSGSLPLTFMADWDVELPLNIEDQDISPEMANTPQEHQGITSVSYCLWTYDVLKQQRSFRRPDGSRCGSSWMVDQSLSREKREALIHEMENSANDRLIRYCDPIQSMDNLILIMARSLIWTFRRALLHCSILAGENSETDEEIEKKTLC